MKKKPSLQPLTSRQILKWALHTKYSYFTVFVCGQQLLAQPGHAQILTAYCQTQVLNGYTETPETKAWKLRIALWSLTRNEEQYTQISWAVYAFCSEDSSLETTACTMERVGEMLYTKLCQCLSSPTYTISWISFNKHTNTEVSAVLSPTLLLIS